MPYSHWNWPPMAKNLQLLYHKLTALATQWHGGITCVCHCVAKIASSNSQWRKTAHRAPKNSVMMTNLPLSSAEVTSRNEWGLPLPTKDARPSPKTPQHAFYLQYVWGGMLASTEVSVSPDAKLTIPHVVQIALKAAPSHRRKQQETLHDGWSVES